MAHSFKLGDLVLFKHPSEDYDTIMDVIEIGDNYIVSRNIDHEKKKVFELKAHYRHFKKVKNDKWLKAII